ncbi:MAG: hypothetical protein ACK4VY_02415 [Brevundimonas sp.]
MYKPKSKSKSHAGPEPAAFSVNPRPVSGDASSGVVLGYQRQREDERRQGVGLDEEAAQLLPLMLSLARVSARAVGQGANQ